MDIESTAFTVGPSSNWSYERSTRLFGAIWFLALAFLVAVQTCKTVIDPSFSLLSGFCLAVFYFVVAFLILTRAPARAQADGLLPRIAALVGTYLPWTITFFGKTDQTIPNVASSVCVVSGTIMMLFTVRHLGRSFSLIPQARTVVQTGPYRWIKHPLYLAEEIAILGVTLRCLSQTTMSILILHIAIQIRRILYEEDLLRRTCPEYSSYEVSSRWRLIPFVW